MQCKQYIASAMLLLQIELGGVMKYSTRMYLRECMGEERGKGV
jgi:hypothetical protein